MESITENDFLEKFMEICQNLTYSEVRMLYLLITEPSIADLPQESFARRINTHRRTINIGLKKLRKLKYIYESNTSIESEVVNNTMEKDDDALLAYEKKTAEKVVINAFNDYYGANRKDYIINEDFFYFILGDIRLNEKYRNNRPFVIKTIRETYPKVRFHFDLKKQSFSTNNYVIIDLINSEITRATKNRLYNIRTDILLEKIYNNFSIEKEDALKIIKTAFPKLRITEKHIRMRRPWKGKGSSRMYDV